MVLLEMVSFPRTLFLRDLELIIESSQHKLVSLHSSYSFETYNPFNSFDARLRERGP